MRETGIFLAGKLDQISGLHLLLLVDIFLLSHLFVQRWSRCGSVCPFASPGLQVHLEIEGDRRINIDASMATHRLGNGITPWIPVESSANSTCRYPIRTLLGRTYSQEGVSSARRARRTKTTTFDLPTTRLLDPQPR